MNKVRKRFSYDGKIYNAYGNTLEEAIEKMVLKKQELESGKAYRETKMPVKEWAIEAVELYKTNQSDITRDRYMSVMRANIFSEIGSLPLSAVSQKDCQTILNNLKGKSTDHIRKIKNMLVFIFTTAMDNKLIKENPTTNLSIPKGTKKKSRAITDKEREAVLELCENDNYLIFLLMLKCGCRPSEARAVKGKDITSEQLLHIRGTKTKSADRYVPIPSDLYSRIKKTLKNENIASCKNYSNLCRAFRSDLYNLLGENYNEDFRAYYLRHTFCTDLKEKNVDIRDAQYLMGHANISMTANIYTHSDKATALKIAKIL